MSMPKRILEVMEQNPKFKWTASALCSTLYYQPDKGIDKKILAQVRTTLNRLCKDSKIRKLKRGYYQIKPTPTIIRKLENPETKVHGLKIEYRLNEHNIFGIDGISAACNVVAFLEANRFEEVCFGNGKSMRRFSRGVFWEERNITFTIHHCGLVEIWCKCSDNPMSLSEFVRFIDFVRGFLSPVCGFEKSKAMLRQIGVNRDFEEQRLDGVSSVTVKKFLNDWCRVYQHGEGVRYEHHLKVDISLEDAFNSLQLLTCEPRSNGYSKLPDERRDVV